METGQLLGLDVGTSGLKAVVFDAKGHALGYSYKEYPIINEEPLQAEQDAELVYALLLQALGEAVRQSGVCRIHALSLSVQGDAMIPVDERFRPMHKALLGMDYRAEKVCSQYKNQYDAWQLYEITGQPLHPMNMMAKIMWLKDRRKEVFEKAYRFVTYADFLVKRLGGRGKIDATMASRSMGYDIRLGEWSEILLQRMGIERNRLSEVCSSGTELGEMDQEIAESIGLENCPKLIAGGHDQTVGAIGAGAISEGCAVDSAGTAEVLSVVYDKPHIEKAMYDCFYSCYYHAVPGLYFSFAHMQTGGLLQRWFRDNLAESDYIAARKKHLDFYEYVHSCCSKDPSEVLVMPHFNGSGTPYCDVKSYGMITGLTFSSTRYDILKGILDGIAYELKINLDTMERTGIKVNTLCAVGGGAKSSLWLQIKADILQKELRTLQCKESGCLGAAILAAVGVGIYEDISQAVREMVHFEHVYIPDKESGNRYLEVFDIYKKMYEQVKPIHDALYKLKREK